MTFRALTRRPLATLVVVITLGVGLAAIGVVAALCSAVLFPPAPYRDGAQLAVLWSSLRPGSTQNVDYLTPKRAEGWLRSPPRSFTEFAAVGYSDRVLRGDEATQRITSAVVSGSFFTLLGVRAARGRMLVNSDSTAAAQPAAVLSDRAWRRFFRADPAVLGQTIDLDSVYYTIVGIAPPELDYPRGTDVWLPSAHVPLRRQPVAFLLVGRIRDGSDLDRARAEVMTRSQVEHRTDSVAYAGQGVTALPLGSTERRLNEGLLPLIAVCIAGLYLIAALNLGILLLLQARRRARELAIRAALGAGTWGALRALVMEIGVQLALGGVMAIFGAFVTLSIIRNRFLFDLAPLTGRAEFVALAAVLLLALMTAALLVPLVARRARAHDLMATLRRASEAMTADAQSQRLRRLLVGAEIAVAMVLACTAGIIGKSLRHFRGVDLGFDAERVVVTRPDYAMVNYDLTRQALLADEVTARMRASQAVEEASYWRRLSQPWPPPATERVFGIDDRTRPLPRGGMLYNFYEVGPRFFETLGIRITQGRTFDANDSRGSLPVAIVNRSAAGQWWPGQSPIGKRVSLNPDDPAAWLTVIGVADVLGLDVFIRGQTARGQTRSQLFRPLSQGGPATAPHWHWELGCFICPDLVIAARASGDPARAGLALQQALHVLAPRLPVEPVRTMYHEDLAGWTGATLTRNVRTMGTFGALAVLIALLGIYGVVADGVATRTRELAIRLALGATTPRLRRMLLRENALLAIAAIGGGALLYLVLTRLAGSMLFGGQYRALLFSRSAADPYIILSVLLLGLLVVALAVGMGSRKALHLDPREGLRAE